MSAEDDAISQIRARKSEADVQEDQRAWAMGQARSLIMRYIRSLQQAGHSPAELQEPTYTRVDFEIASGKLWNKVVRTEHRWDDSYERIGSGWPVLWTLGWATFIRRVEDTYGDTVHPGRQAPQALIYDTTQEEFVIGVPMDSPDGMTSNPAGHGAVEAVVKSRKLLVRPVLAGTSCPNAPSGPSGCDGRCGLPLWAKSYHPDSQESLISTLVKKTNETVVTDMPYYGSKVTLTAPAGRDSRAWNWYLEGLLARLDANLSVLGVEWSD